MRTILLLVVTLIIPTLRVNSVEYYLSMSEVFLTDTIVFDIGQAEYSNNNDVYYIEFPVLLQATDPEINAIDFWFQFDLNKLTYVSTTSLLANLDAFSNFNANNQYLSNTSSTTSISVFLPVNTELMKLKFSLNSPCTDIQTADFFSANALVNGNVSSLEFIGEGSLPEIELISSDPLCENADIVFNYTNQINSSSISEYSWDFGNGDTGDQQSSTVSYSDPGTFPVALTVTTEAGCAYTVNSEVVILESPVVDFTSAYDESSNLVTFDNLSTMSTGSIVTWGWDFGDETGSDEFEPTHEYPGSGLYDVVLTATSDLGCSTAFAGTVDVPIDVLELRLDDMFQVYPNPTSEFIYIRFIEPITYKVIDAAGRIVIKQDTPALNQMISVGELAAGYYTVLGMTETQSFSRNIAVTHD